MSIYDHVWGESASVDAVWSIVAGMPARLADTQKLMVLQAYIDDSATEGGWYVLAGYIASVESWASFTKEWDELLRGKYGTLDAKSDQYHFKMSEMAHGDERMSRVPAFYRVIEKHVLCGLSCRFRMADLRSAKQRVVCLNEPIDWGKYESNFFAAFRSLMDIFHANRNSEIAKLIKPDEDVEFIFDRQVFDERDVHSVWFDYVESRPPETRELYRHTPRFGDDKRFLPIQAADFWAWWVRKWAEEGKPEKSANLEFGSWSADPYAYPRISIEVGEEDFVKLFLTQLRAQAEPDDIILDLGAPWEAIYPQ